MDYRGYVNKIWSRHIH